MLQFGAINERIKSREGEGEKEKMRMVAEEPFIGYVGLRPPSVSKLPKTVIHASIA